MAVSHVGLSALHFKAYWRAETGLTEDILLLYGMSKHLCYVIFRKKMCS